VRYDHNRIIFGQSPHEVLNVQSGNRVKRRSRLVHEDHFRLRGKGTGNAKPLLLAWGQAERVGMQIVFHFVPQRSIG
jgi:hypothetical protein